MSKLYLYENIIRKASNPYTKKISERKNSATIPKTELITVYMIVRHSQTHGGRHLLHTQASLGQVTLIILLM